MEAVPVQVENRAGFQGLFVKRRRHYFEERVPIVVFFLCSFPIGNEGDEQINLRRRKMPLGTPGDTQIGWRDRVPERVRCETRGISLARSGGTEVGLGAPNTKHHSTAAIPNAIRPTPYCAACSHWLYCHGYGCGRNGKQRLVLVARWNLQHGRGFVMDSLVYAGKGPLSDPERSFILDLV